jgi:hypothetical protein
VKLSTKRYYCGGCGASVEGPGRFCDDGCVDRARGVAIARVRARYLPIGLDFALEGSIVPIYMDSLTGDLTLLACPSRDVFKEVKEELERLRLLMLPR